MLAPAGGSCRARARRKSTFHRYHRRAGCRAAKKKKNAVSASARSRKPPSKPEPRAASACRWSSAACSAWSPWSASSPCSSFVVFSGDDSASDEVAGGGAAIPAQKEADPEKAAAPAKCTYEPKLPNEGSGHEEKDFKASDYKQNPPTSGNHFPQWYEDGIYAPGDTPELGKLVHTLEHGRIDIQYKPGTPATTVAQLETLYNEMDGGHHLLLFENGTGMKSAVAATAWDHRSAARR